MGIELRLYALLYIIATIFINERIVYVVKYTRKRGLPGSFVCFLSLVFFDFRCMLHVVCCMFRLMSVGRNILLLGEEMLLWGI